MIEINGVPRRNILSECSSAELAISKAITEVEHLPADEKLTNAIQLLSQARELVSDFIDYYEPLKEKEISFGEQLVRTNFNPSDDSIVQNIKERFAETANYVNDNIENGRLKSIAITTIEEASMWAVKAATA